MAVTLILYIVVILALFAVKRKIENFTHTIEEKVNFIQRLVDDPARVAINVGSAVAGKALKKASTIVRKK